MLNRFSTLRLICLKDKGFTFKSVKIDIHKKRRKDYQAIMKLAFLVMTILIGCNFVQAQENSQEMLEKFENISNAEIPTFENIRSKGFSFFPTDLAHKNNFIRLGHSPNSLTVKSLSVPKEETNFRKFESDFFKTERKESISTIYADNALSNSASKDREKQERFHWKPALAQSLYFLTIQHGFRMIQKKTRDELDGPFLRDWANSVKNLGRWRDGDSTFTNYVAHPMQGAVTGRIFINNSDKSKVLEFENSKEYWERSLKAMIWSAVWSTQFELGPISEASIGNVGLYDRRGPNRMGFVDLVVTPIAGTAVLIGEDMIDKYILKKRLEKKAKSRIQIMIFRTFITPFQSFANVLRGTYPWKRNNR